MRIDLEHTLKDVLEDHALWLQDSDTGSRADLSFANLSFADLSFANLRSADLSFANLRSADLRFANLSSADLRSVDLSFADLSFADLRSADLSFANLRFADLSSVDLSSANLSSVDLYQFNAGRHTALANNGFIRLGCIYKSIAEWLKEYIEIGRDNEYTEQEIEDYGDFIKWYAKKCKL